MARTIYSYTDPVMDVLVPHAGGANEGLFLGLARLAYLPALVAVLWTWGSLVGYAEDPTVAAHALLPFGMYADTLTWMLPVAAVVLGWTLWRTSAGALTGFKSSLASVNVVATGFILVLCLINMLRILLIATLDAGMAGALASVWVILAVSVAAVVR